MPPKAAASRNASTSKSPPKRKSKVQSDEPTYPFEKWTVAKLQAEVKKYGFKTSRSRDTLIDRLKAVHQALESSKSQQTGASGDASMPRVEDPATTIPSLNGSTPSRKPPAKGKGRKSDPFVVASSSSSRSNSRSPTPSGAVTPATLNEPGDFTLQLEREALSEADSSSSEDIPLAQQSPATSDAEDDDEGPGVEAGVHFSNTMAKAVKRDSQLWLRILRFEPISFDEFVSVAVQAGFDMGPGRRKIELRSWLDRQCVCFYTNDLTGPRSRH